MEKDDISPLLGVYRVSCVAFLHTVLPKGILVNLCATSNQSTIIIPGGISGTKVRKKKKIKPANVPWNSSRLLIKSLSFLQYIVTYFLLLSHRC